MNTRKMEVGVMDYKPLPIGIDNFEMLITRGYYFIDKTLFIKDLIDNKASVNLFTRPRRFEYNERRKRIYIAYGTVSCNQFIFEICKTA